MSARRERRHPTLREPTALDQAPPRPADRPALRLALANGVLGIELDAPFEVGPLLVTELVVALPSVRFPVDLSGGVTRFRHRRGALARVAVEVRAAGLAAWSAPKLRGILGAETPDVVIAPIESGFAVGLASGASALAFDVLVAPLDGDVRLLLDGARGWALTVAPHQLAARAVAAVLGSHATSVSGAFVVPRMALEIAKRLLPIAGARAPSASGVRWEAFEADVSVGRMRAAEGASPPALVDRVVSALETAEIVGDAERLAGSERGLHAPSAGSDLDRVRAAYLQAIERAPRHRALSERLAWLDAKVEGRAEAALGTLVDAIPVAFAGALGGELLLAVGDRPGAQAALAHAARTEPFGALAARLWLAASTCSEDAASRLEALDQAAVRAPGLDLVRWARLEARLDLADVRGAKADAEHLEAAARGSEARHAVVRRAAEAFAARGRVAEATGLFERALRYAPDDPSSVIGLAQSLRAAGKARRALDLFARAVAIADRRALPAWGARIALAEALVELVDDRPAAIARVRTVPVGEPESFAARFLEGRWRAELGDVAGARVAFGRLRSAAELGALGATTGAEVATMLAEAAALEEREGDLAEAEASLGLALRLAPRDRAIGTTFRRVASRAREARGGGF